MNIFLQNTAFVFYTFTLCLIFSFFGGAVDFSFWTISLASIFLLCLISLSAFFDTKIKTAFDALFGNFNFYFACMFLLYVAVAIFNPEIEYVKQDDFSYIKSLDFIKWLPSSVGAQLVEYNPASQAAGLAAVFSFMFSTFLLVRTQSLVKILCRFIFAVSVPYAIYCIYVRIQNGTCLLEILDKGILGYSGAFIYHSMGNAAFMTMIAMVGLLYLEGFKNRQSSMQILRELAAAIAMFIIYAAIYVSNGSGGRVFGALEILLILTFPAAKILFHRAFVRRIFIALCACAAVGVGVWYVGLDDAQKRQRDGSIGSDLSGRVELWKTSLGMVLQGGDYGCKTFDADTARHLIFGRGAASYVKLSRPYFYNDAKYASADYKDLKNEYAIADYPHSSVLTSLFEFGIFGSAIVLIWLICYVGKSFSAYNPKNFPVFALYFGFGTILVYSIFDMLLENICVASLVCMLAMLAQNYLNCGSAENRDC